MTIHKCLSNAGIALVSLLTVLSAHAMPAGFSKFIDISFPGYPGVAPVQNFPVLVRLSSAIEGFSYSDMGSPADGADLRFFTSEDVELAYEIDTWNPAGTSLIWVKLPELSAATTIQAYYGNPNLTAPAYRTDGTVWRDQYIGVWHLNDDLIDSAAHGLQAEAMVDTTITDTLLGRGAYTPVGAGGLSGILITNGVAYNNVTLADASKFTASGWFQPISETISSKRFFSRKYNWEETVGWEVFTYGGSEIGVRGKNKNDGYRFKLGTAFVTVPAPWIHMAYVSDGSTVRFYSNGVSVAADPASKGYTAAGARSDAGIGFGRYASTTTQAGISGTSFQGYMDEMRVLKTAASADWAKAEFATVADNGFSAYSAVGSASTDLPWVISQPAENVGLYSATAKGTLAQVGTPAPTVYLDWGTDPEFAAPTTVNLGVIATDGDFTTPLTGLLPDTTYCYRYRAISTAGESIGETVSFITAGKPAFSDATLTSELNTCYCSAELTTLGDGPITVVCWLGETPETLQAVKTWGNVTEPGTFEWTVANLAYGQAYFCTYSATWTYQGREITGWSITNSAMTAGSAIWTGLQNSDWSTANNWNIEQVPNARLDAAVFGAASISIAANAECKTLVVDSADPVTLTSSATLAASEIRVGTNALTHAVLRGGQTTILPDGALYVSTDRKAQGTTLTLTDGASLNTRAAVISDGGTNYGNRLIIGNAGSAQIGNVANGRAQSRNNEVHVLAGGALTVTNSIYNYGGENIFLVDGGAVTNLGTFVNAYRQSLSETRACYVRVTNGGYLRQIGDFNINNWYNGYVEVLNGGHLDATGVIYQGDNIADQGGVAYLVVSNATLTGTTIRLPNDPRRWEGNLLLHEDAGQTTTVTLSGALQFGCAGGDRGARAYANCNNALRVNGGRLAIGTDFQVGGGSKLSTNNVVSIAGETARITAGSIIFGVSNRLEYTLPANGFAQIPLETEGTATLAPTTWLTIDTTAMRSGRHTLLKASTLADNSIPPEQITVVNNGKRLLWEVIQRGNELVFQAYPPLTAVIIQ